MNILYCCHFVTGVVLTGQETTPDTVSLQEGEDSNSVVFTTIAQSAEDSSTVRQGLDLWIMALYGSSNPDGSGPQYNRQTNVLSPYHASLPLREPGGTITYPNVVAYYDMRDLRCRDVQYLCTELDKNPAREFQLEVRPNREVLIDCFRVENCQGMRNMCALYLHFIKLFFCCLQNRILRVENYIVNMTVVGARSFQVTTDFVNLFFYRDFDIRCTVELNSNAVGYFHFV